MPAHNRGELSLEGYLLRVLAALCKQSNGELRISGAEVDRVGEATCLIKEWDPDHQQVVLRVETIAFREVFRLTPEKQITREAAPPARMVDATPRLVLTSPPNRVAQREEADVPEHLPHNNTLDDARVAAGLELQRAPAAERILRTCA